MTIRRLIALVAVAAAAAAAAPAAAIPPPRQPAAPVPVSFTTVASGSIEGQPERSHVYIARSRSEAQRWADLIGNRWRTAMQRTDFSRSAIVALFYRQPVKEVKVTSLAVDGETLALSIEVIPWPVYSCAPPGLCPPRNVPRLPGVYTLVAVRKGAIAGVERVVVTNEVDDPQQVIAAPAA